MATKIKNALDSFVTYMSSLEKAHLANYKRTLLFSK